MGGGLGLGGGGGGVGGGFVWGGGGGGGVDGGVGGEDGVFGGGGLFGGDVGFFGGAAAQFMRGGWRGEDLVAILRVNWVVRGVVYSYCAMGLVVLAAETAQRFIYFQF